MTSKTGHSISSEKANLVFIGLIIQSPMFSGQKVVENENNGDYLVCVVNEKHKHGKRIKC